MKVEDLMIGDWVLYKSDSLENAFPIQITREMFNKELVVWNDRFEPIPLTPEILEKNGFKKNISNTKMCLDTHEYRLIYNLTNRLFTIFNESENAVLVQKSTVTVHKLQHALKLCGIDKDIIV